ncbi:arylsulfatase [Niabella yanshanensis]|uniref:Arylsulfatase n=1 Tax=Niabella yanshanensis TaxID=577386 RepID=A0ABZ0W495_9BACT|nr:arylsulfatase [Niabella yanshanensis]WQD38062.1 arylsulfatase [Niabella yanshanensis]
MKFKWLLSFLPVLLAGFYSTSIAQPKKPNIILILADDLGVGDLGVYGQQKIKTPNLDRLAKDGLQFNQFYTGTSVCAPSRSSLMTGQHTGHTPVRGNKATQPEGQWPLPPGVVTIAGLLKEAGYTTGDFGKWGLGFVGTSGDPNQQGFDEFYGYNCQSLAHNYFPEHLWHNSSKISLPNTMPNQTVYAAQLIHDKAQQFIQKNSQQPFFLFLSYTLPHAALQLPANDSLLAYYIRAFKEKPVTVATGWQGKGYQPQAYPHAAYAAMVGRLDQYVGAIRKQVEALGIADNTLILFASDNGPHKEGGNDPVFFNSSAGLKGMKRDLYEGGVRTPFIAWWPGTIKAGRRSEWVGAFWDLLPTFADLAGVKVTSPTDGISMVPELKNQPQKRHDHLYWEFHEQGGKQAVRLGNWKGIRLNAMAHPDGPVELYDLRSDAAEKHNVAAGHPEIVARIAAIMKKEHVENENFPFFQQASK